MALLKYAVLILITLSHTAFAQYVGPSNLVKTELSQIIDKPVDDDYVKVQGYLIKKVSSDKYILSDGKQQIRVEIDDYVFPSQPFGENDLIEIEGEIEKDFLESPEIDVNRLTVINK